jgi:cycloeucalenol cycloisomerase
MQANIWIFIFGFVGNYFWTHYFYTVLGATYSFPSYKLNHVPLTAYLLTHSYFLFYHMISNFTIRRLRHAISDIKSSVARFLIEAVWIFVLSYVTAFMEAFTVANVSTDAFLFVLLSFAFLLSVFSPRLVPLFCVRVTFLIWK